MQSFLIDPTTATVSIMSLPNRGDRLASIYRLLDCATITAVPFHETDVIYVHDEALLKGPSRFMFAVCGYPHPLFGKGLLVGTTTDGRDTPPAMSYRHACRRLRFIECINDRQCLLRTPNVRQNPILTKFKNVLDILAEEAA